VSDSEKTPNGSPAIISDELWGGPRFIENAGHEPVYVETKKEYWDLLNRRGLRMKDQQESTTGPEREVLEPTGVTVQPVPHLDPFSYDEATLVHGADRVNRNLGLVETIDCDICFALGRHSGTRIVCRPTLVRVECRCGSREYIGPVGTDGAVVWNAARTLADRTTGGLFDGHGEYAALPTILIQSEEATILRQYTRMLAGRRLTAGYFCRGCWDGRPTATKLRVKISRDEIVMACSCRLRFFR